MKGKSYRTKPLKDRETLNFSQNKVTGFDLETFQRARILMIGAGGIGSLVALAMVRKGIGILDILDDDKVESKNLTRQIFSKSTIGKNKAVSLARMLSKQGFFNTTITGYPYRFQQALEYGLRPEYDAVICGVDNNPTRIDATRWCLDHIIPLIVSAVSRDASLMYCAIQEPGRACFGCIMPRAINNNVYPCNLPGIIDIMLVVSGFTVFALDTVLMKRYREWNLVYVSLDGVFPYSAKTIEKKENCPICRK